MPTCIPVVKLVGEMAKLFDGVNRYILFIQLLALLVGVCFISPSLQLSEKRLLPRNSEGNAVSNTARGKEGLSVNLNQPRRVADTVVRTCD